MREVQAQKRKIGDYSYRVTPLGVGKGKALLVRLARAMGPALAAAVDGIGSGGGSLAKLPAGVLAPGIRELAASLNEEDLDYAVEVLAETTEVSSGGEWAELDKLVEFHFRGAYDELLQWLWFSLEVNYGSFRRFLSTLAALGAAQPGAAGPDTSPSRSPST